MTSKRLGVVCVFVGLLLALGAFIPAASGVGRIDQLKKHIEAVCAGTVGTVGVAAKLLETGEELTINADEPFPMASTFKLPVLVEVLAQVKEGKFSLDEEVSVGARDQHLGSGLLSALAAPGITLSVRNLALLMMMISDNSAADILLAKVGPENVNKRLRQFGLQGISVNRSCQQLILDLYGLDYGTYGNRSIPEIEGAAQNAERARPEHFEQVRKDFSENPLDQSTPRALNLLLQKIFMKEILDPASCDLALDILFKCQTGAGRIRGLLPAGTAVAHKTGTIDGTVNDTGLIVLPDGLGHVALTVLSKDFPLENTDMEKIISQVARYVYDYFTFSR